MTINDTRKRAGNFKYDYNESMDKLKTLFYELNRVPTKKDFINLNIKPARDWYIDIFGSMENACHSLGLIKKTLSNQEKIDTSIQELKDIAKIKGGIPNTQEYNDYRKDGFRREVLAKKLNMTYDEMCDKYLSEYIVEIPVGYYKCSGCQSVKKLDEFHIGSSQCRVCSFLNRNKENINIEEDWTINEYKLILDYILNERSDTINGIVDILPHKSLNEIVKIINDLNIGAKRIRFKTTCSQCGKDVIRKLNEYDKNENFYCGMDCYWLWKKENTPTGEDNPDYNRITTNCDNCYKEIHVKPSSFNKENSYGEKHSFCNHECYSIFKSTYYVGEKSSRYGYKFSEDELKRARIRTTKFYTDGVFDRETKPQQELNGILDEMCINYTREYNCKYYSVDNYLIDHNLMIEVNGDYFHAHPTKYKKINKMQHKGVSRDKRKSTYIKRYHDTTILYLWESDLMNNRELCERLVEFYIESKGVLQSYHSFDYFLDDDGKLLINNILTQPYMEWDLKSIKAILKLPIIKGSKQFLDKTKTS